MNWFDKVKTYVKQNPQLWWALYLPVYLLLFFLVEHIVTPESDYWVSWTPLDDQIPFLEGFVIPYSLWYPMLVSVGLYAMLRNPPAFQRYMLFLAVGFTASLLICLVFPNGQNLRPAAFPRENLCTWLLARIYSADTNTNVLPSMHVVGACAAVCAVFDCPGLRRLRIPAILLAAAIAASTVFVKQHSILDIYAGLLLSVPILLVIYHKAIFRGKRRQKQPHRQPQKQPEK